MARSVYVAPTAEQAREDQARFEAAFDRSRIFNERSAPIDPRTGEAAQGFEYYQDRYLKGGTCRHDFRWEQLEVIGDPARVIEQITLLRGRRVRQPAVRLRQHPADAAGGDEEGHALLRRRGHARLPLSLPEEPHDPQLSHAVATSSPSTPAAARGVTAVVDGDVRLTYPDSTPGSPGSRTPWPPRGVDGRRPGAVARPELHAVLELLLACSRLGAVFCPANWRQSADELRFVLDDLDPAASSSGNRPATTADAGRRLRRDWAPAGDRRTRTARWRAAGGLTDARSRIPPRSRDTAPVLALYTAAFDGRPNAALLSSAALLAHSASLLVVRQMEPGLHLPRTTARCSTWAR